MSLKPLPVEMVEPHGGIRPAILEPQDRELVALHQAASRAEEAASRIENHAMATQTLSSTLIAKPEFYVPWEAPLTPDDSAEENLGLSQSSFAGKTIQQAKSADQTPMLSQTSVTSSDAFNPRRKRGRPRKQNLIDSIVGHDLQRQLPMKQGRPHGPTKHQAGRNDLSTLTTISTPIKLESSSVVNGFQGSAAQSGDCRSAGNVSNVSSQSRSFSRDFPGQTSNHTAASSSALTNEESRQKFLEENNILKAVFNLEIAPIMHYSMMNFEGKLPRDVLIAVGRAFADEILNRRLRAAIQNGCYAVTLQDKQIATGTINRMLNQKLEDLSRAPMSQAPNSLHIVAAQTLGIESRHSGVAPETAPVFEDIRGKGDVKVRSSSTGETYPVRSPSLPESQALEQGREPSLAASPQIGAPSGFQSQQAIGSQRRGSSSSYARKKSSVISQLRTTLATELAADNLFNSEQDLYASSFHVASHRTYSKSTELVSYESPFPSRPPSRSSHRSIYEEDTMPRHSRYVERSSSESESPVASGSTKNRRRRRSGGAPASLPSRTISSHTRASNTMTRVVSAPVPAPAPAAVYSSKIPQKVRWALHECNINSMLRQREFGYGRWYSGGESVQTINRMLELEIAKRLRCWRSWAGASKDVLTAIWAPNGCTYAAGASTEMDSLNIQYNRPNNLLLGNFDQNTLIEVPDHYIDRPTPDTIASGDKSRADTYNSLDPELYTTISSICFDDTSSRMFTGSFDKTVKVWSLDVEDQPLCISTLQHAAEVDLLAASYEPLRLLASGQRTTVGAIRVYDQTSLDWEDYNEPPKVFGSTRTSKVNVYPTCLLWGRTSFTSNLLLAGFAESNNDIFNHDQQGNICLWDVETGKSHKIQPAAQAVHDITWHPTLPLFAAATVPGNRKGLSDPQHTKSLIRTWEPFQGPSRVMEYECPALDINDVRFHPYDDHYITAGCTDGVTYVWDVRKPDTILHRLRHGKPIDELDHDRSREEQDTGVRFTAWDKYGKDLYTGSSDGVIAAWNILVSQEDAFIRNVAQFDAGVMTGTFSPDYSNLLVGLSKGALHVLSTTTSTHDPNDDLDAYHDDEGSDHPPKAYDTITYIPAPRTAPKEETSGIEAANYLIITGQIVMHPTLGAGRGPNYHGPYASYARLVGADPATDDLDPDIQASQLDPLERRKGERLGGFVDRETEARYKNAQKVARERNFLPIRFQEGKRTVKKRAVDDETDGEEAEDYLREGDMKVKAEGQIGAKAPGAALKKKKASTGLGKTSFLAGYDIWEDAVLWASETEAAEEGGEGGSDVGSAENEDDDEYGKASNDEGGMIEEETPSETNGPAAVGNSGMEADLDVQFTGERRVSQSH